MWSHYADKHKGVCLGFDVGEDDNLLEVNYTNKRLEFSLDNLDESHVKTLLRTKYQGWRYEDEVRIFTTLTEKCEQTQNYYMQFGPALQLREVIAGRYVLSRRALSRQ